MISIHCLYSLFFFSAFFFFFKQKTAYEMRISDWSSDVCSSDLGAAGRNPPPRPHCPGGQAPSSGGLRRHAAFVPEVEADRDAVPAVDDVDHHGGSEERRVGKACVSTCRSRWAPYT